MAVLGCHKTGAWAAVGADDAGGGLKLGLGVKHVVGLGLWLGVVVGLEQGPVLDSGGNLGRGDDAHGVLGLSFDLGPAFRLGLTWIRQCAVD